MLTVIMGGMFSEKTTELIRRGRRAKRAGHRVLYMKPEVDNRYAEEKIVTHDGIEVDSVVIRNDQRFDLGEIINKYDVICIDEVQFFGDEIIVAINTLIMNGKTVIVAGLDMSYNAEPFKTTAILATFAEEVVKLKAVCSSCGTDAWISYRKTKSTELVELGSDEAYKPLCRSCYVRQSHADYLDSQEQTQIENTPEVIEHAE